MILLSGHSMTPARRVPLENMSLNLKERDSTASMTPAAMDGITMNSWFKDDTEPGKDIVWRVRSIKEAFVTNTPVIQMEHIISTLKDVILFGEIKTEKLAGKKGATTVSAKTAIQYILGRQKDWTLGRFDYGNVTNPYKFDGDTLFDAIEKITDSLDSAIWTYDMTVYPFKLNIIKPDDTVGSELRAGRNLRTITRTIDKSGMYTRVYPIGKEDLHLDGEYVEKNVSTYGLVSKTMTDQTIDSKAELKRWANELLNKHAEPTVTIEVEGLELAAETGEPLDKLTLHRVCRAPLPEYSTIIKERITALNYPDKIHQPSMVKITMANNRRDITKILAEAMKRSGGGGRAAAREKKEDHAWFEDTNHHVAMVAEGIVGVDSKGEPNWTRLSEIIVDGTGIHQMVEGVRDGLTLANTRIDQNEYSIQLEAKRATKAEGNLRASIKVYADQIELKVSKNNIISSINQTAETITISASKINLTGYTTIQAFNALNGTVDGILAAGTFGSNKITSTQINATGTLAASSTFNYKGHTIGTYSVMTTGGVTFYALGYTL